MDGSPRRRKGKNPARYRYVVLGDSPHDGGWVRVFENFKDVESAKEAIEWFMPMMVRYSDYRRVRIVKTIVFHP